MVKGFEGSVRPDSVGVEFDDERLIANAGLVLIATLGRRLGIEQNKRVAERIAEIPESAWRPVPDYPETGICELAETTYGDRRLIVRRVHLRAQEEQTELFAYWRHFAFLTNREEDMHAVDAEHRRHAEVELAIRDLKDIAVTKASRPSAAAKRPHQRPPIEPLAVVPGEAQLGAVLGGAEVA